jgi:uncharacterized caspase-like protein
VDQAIQKQCEGAYVPPKQGVEARYGLVIGNIGYRSAKLQPLVSPERDAQQITAALTSAGFSVRKCLNLNKNEMNQEIDALAAATAKASAAWTGPRTQGPAAFLYFSGHGASTERNPENYLIPVREEIESPVQLPGNAIKLSDITDKLAETGARVAFVAVDACRNALAEEKGGGGKGLLALPARANIVRLYAAAPGKTAPDNNNYSTALAAQIRKTPPDEATLMFKRVADAVRELDPSQNPHSESGGYDGDFFFQPSAKK